MLIEVKTVMVALIKLVSNAFVSTALAIVASSDPFVLEHIFLCQLFCNLSASHLPHGGLDHRNSVEG